MFRRKEKKETIRVVFIIKTVSRMIVKNCTVDDKYSAIRRSILPISETTDGLRSRVIECSIKQVAVIKRFYELGYIAAKHRDRCIESLLSEPILKILENGE